MSYVVGILSEVGDIFLRSCSQVFSLLNVRFRGILNNIKIQSKVGNPLIDSIDKTYLIAKICALQ